MSQHPTPAAAWQAMVEQRAAELSQEENEASSHCGPYGTSVPAEFTAHVVTEFAGIGVAYAALMGLQHAPADPAPHAAELAAAHRNLALLQGDNARMAEALRQLREQFLRQEQVNLEYGQADSARHSKRYADVAHKALNAVQPYAPQPKGEFSSTLRETVREVFAAPPKP
jgi:hypothetical protein